jgi:hypothetical protein
MKLLECLDINLPEDAFAAISRKHQGTDCVDFKQATGFMVYDAENDTWFTRRDTATQPVNKSLSQFATRKTPHNDVMTIQKFEDTSKSYCPRSRFWEALNK